jgi:membrane-anchored protein YejM (alkaline phosphatase superfamily)
MMIQTVSSKKKAVTLYTVIAFLSFAYLYSQYTGELSAADFSGKLSVYVFFSLWLHFFTIATLVLILIVFLERKLDTKGRLWLVVVAIAASVLTAYLYIDSKLFTTTGLHLNSFVIESLMQDAALQQIGITPGQLMHWAWPLGVFLSVHLFIQPLSRYRIVSIPVELKHMAVIMIVMSVLVGTDKLLFSYFYYKGKPFVFQLKETPPAYLVPHSYYIDKLFSLLSGDGTRVNFTQPLEDEDKFTKRKVLNYSDAFQTGDIEINSRFNLIMVVAESLRKHDIDSQTAPFFTSLANESIEALNHYSSSNTTHFGLFSLLYGLNPYYFHDFRINLTESIAIKILKENGYQIYATAAQTMRWYDQDRFLLGNNPEIYIAPEGKNYERDRQVTDKSINIARHHKKTGTPYFNLIYYYTTHADYEHPQSHSLFKPSITGKVDFADPALRGEKRSQLVNRYRNAIHYVDSELKRLVEGIMEAGAGEDTILVFTGDHGEEFYEDNTFGHNSNLNEYQTRVPLLVHVPGYGYNRVEKLTSHMDVMKTLLGFMSDAPIPDTYFQGRDMLSNETGAIYVAKAHYQKPTAYAVHMNGKKAIVSIDRGYMEIESISDREGSHRKPDKELKRGIAGLVNQITELKK